MGSVTNCPHFRVTNKKYISYCGLGVEIMVCRHDTRFVGLVVVMFLFVKGFTGQVLSSVLLPYYNEVVGATMKEYHLKQTIIMVPWAFKIVFALLSDLLPICGYRQWVYMMASCGVLFITTSLLSGNVEYPTLWFTLSSCAMVMLDLIFSSECVRRMKDVSDTSILIIMYVSTIVGACFGAVGVGVAAGMNDVLAPLYVTPIAPFVLGLMLFFWWEEKPRVRVVHPKLIGVSVVHIIGTFSLLFGMIHGDAAFMLGISFSWLVVIVVTAIFFLSRELAVGVLALAALNQATDIRITGITDYFFTDECPGTPNMSYEVYITALTITGLVGSLIGIGIYEYITKKWLISRVFIGIALLRGVVGIIDLSMAYRLGWAPDYILLLGGTGIIEPILGIVSWMMLVPLIGALSEEDSHTITYALATSYANFGVLFSSIVGYSMMGKNHVCDFSGYPSMIMLGSILIPLGLIPVAYLTSLQTF